MTPLSGIGEIRELVTNRAFLEQLIETYSLESDLLLNEQEIPIQIQKKAESYNSVYGVTITFGGKEIPLIIKRYSTDSQDIFRYREFLKEKHMNLAKDYKVLFASDSQSNYLILSQAPGVPLEDILLNKGVGVSSLLKGLIPNDEFKEELETPLRFIASKMVSIHGSEKDNNLMNKMIREEHALSGKTVSYSGQIYRPDKIDFMSLVNGLFLKRRSVSGFLKEYPDELKSFMEDWLMPFQYILFPPLQDESEYVPLQGDLRFNNILIELNKLGVLEFDAATNPIHFVDYGNYTQGIKEMDIATFIVSVCSDPRFEFDETREHLFETMFLELYNQVSPSKVNMEKYYSAKFIAGLVNYGSYITKMEKRGEFDKYLYLVAANSLNFSLNTIDQIKTPKKFGSEIWREVIRYNLSLLDDRYDTITIQGKKSNLNGSRHTIMSVLLSLEQDMVGKVAPQPQEVINHVFSYKPIDTTQEKTTFTQNLGKYFSSFFRGFKAIPQYL
jgi:hypothetical protein